MTTALDSRPAARGRDAADGGSPGRNTRPRWMSRAAVNAALVIAAVYTFFPAMWMLVAAAKSSTGIMDGHLLSFSDFDLLGNLRGLMHQDGGVYFRWLLNSFLYAGVGSVCSALVSCAAGYAFDKYHFRGKEKLFGLVLLGVLVPSAATVLPMYLLASKVHLVNTVWAVLIPSVVNPFGVYLARVFAQGYVPDEVVEAARVDGAGEVRIFGTIGLPMMRSGFTTILLFQFSAIWNGFFLALVMLSNQNLYPVSLGLFIWDQGVATDGPSLISLVIFGSVIAVTPVIVLFICLQRFWRSGLTAGSVK
ncbi:carbohydrate ABC transporter permease [Streptacidiphilus pinicola]|uniref:Carbohydrate ABC transporter permease n=1 Tax=Streptacidiphilus pinicola TaxID=2219663 RepID=A0A2X0ICJ5_9ACTN|nr:carbohydrate ABC transporter permease [Streptacidiphilus pinicola]RAG81313.1 carbohydrate ABC transporter permease [Streptacidiphilus pinicola]